MRRRRRVALAARAAAAARARRRRGRQQRCGVVTVGMEPLKVQIFKHCGYRGYEVSLPPGQYKLPHGSARDNDISSLRFPDGCEVEMFDGADFSGSSKKLSSDVGCLVSHGWNDKLSSIALLNKPQPSSRERGYDMP